MSDVFISYAHEDLAEARNVAEAVSARGLSVFWDRTIPTGRTFEAVIEEAIGSANAVVVLWSRNSVRSNWVRAEASEGANREILVPATLDGERPPLRYRISQTADLTDWRPGSETDSFRVFISDIVATARRHDSAESSISIPGDRGNGNRPHSIQRDTADASIRRCLDASIASAWVGSLALAVTGAYDYGVITTEVRIWAAAYWLTVVSLVAGAASSIPLGFLSFKRHFVLGTLQGWLWPVLAAFAQLLILMSASNLVRALPFASELERLLIFALFGTIGPALLTVGAVMTKRSLEASKSRHTKVQA